MTNLVLEYSRYLMLLIVILYSILNLYALRSVDVAWQNRLSMHQMFLLFLLHTLGYLIVYIKTEDIRMVAFYGIQLAVFLMYYVSFGFIYRHGSRLLIGNTLTLIVIGLLLQTRLDFEYALRQFVFVCAGLVLTLLIPVVIRYMHVLAKWGWVYAVVGVALLVMVWVVGNTTYGAQLSISIGGFALQPSEFVKIVFVFMTASLLQKSTSFKNVVIITVIAAIHVLVLVASTDLGSALVYFVSYLFMLFVATHQPLYMAAGFGAGGIAAVGAYYMFSHVRVRVMMWKDPFFDYDNKSRQIAQSMFAISTGGWLGSGFYQGMPKLISLVRNDFIFAAICEELGAIFAICLILIYLGFVLQMIWVSTWMNELFYKIVGFGLAVMFGFQVFLHIGGVTKLIPCTGITLPLISYGGSSVLTTLIMIGIIQGLHLMKEREAREFERYEREPEEDYEDEYEEVGYGRRRAGRDDRYIRDTGRRQEEDFDFYEEERTSGRRRR